MKSLAPTDAGHTNWIAIQRTRVYLWASLYIVLMLALYFIVRKSYLEYNSSISIRNMRWHRVHVQVRKGFNPDPGHNKLVFDQYLALGQSRTFTIDDGDDIMYRRDVDPDHPDGVHFTNWAYADCAGSSACSVDNP
ncbi:MAG: hypothetical protein JST19_05665 [Bacteroidetes bacterium]|nr:hypothetical protein [Bacteroidota bacterium]